MARTQKPARVHAATPQPTAERREHPRAVATTCVRRTLIFVACGLVAFSTAAIVAPVARGATLPWTDTSAFVAYITQAIPAVWLTMWFTGAALLLISLTWTVIAVTRRPTRRSDVAASEQLPTARSHTEPPSTPSPASVAKSQHGAPTVFISHSSANNQFGIDLAQRLASALRSADAVWYDATGKPDNDFATGLGGGDRWWERIKEEIRTRAVFVVILSPEAMASKWVIDEIDLAWAAAKIIVPILYRECAVPDDLRLIQMVSFEAPTQFDEAFEKLLAAVRLGRSRRVDSSARRLRPIGMPAIPHLYGRDSEKSTVLQALRDNDSIGIYALKGMGGIGKTALAAWITQEAVKDEGHFPGGAAWIPCDNLKSKDDLLEIFRKIARTFGRDDVALETGPEALQRRVVELLYDQPRTLLTLDNVEPELPVDQLLQLLRIPEHTALLVTARHRLDVDLTQVILDPLDDLDGARLFIHRLKSIAKTRSKKGEERPTEEEKQYIPAIVAALGGLPLAIRLTATYCGNQAIHVGKMLHTLEHDKLNAGPFADPQHGLHACFDRSLRALTQEQQRLFAGLSLFAGASIPRGAALTVATAIMLESQNDETSSNSQVLIEDRKQAIGEQAVISLVDAAVVDAVIGERLRLHPLLRAYAEERFASLDPIVQATLGTDMLYYWTTFAEENANDFGDLALTAEREGLDYAAEWAHSHGRPDIADRISQARARAGTVRTLVQTNVLSRMERSPAYDLHVTEQYRKVLQDLITDFRGDSIGHVTTDIVSAIASWVHQASFKFKSTITGPGN